MEIFFSDIPDEGLAVSGVLPAELFGLAKDDPIRTASSLSFDVTLYSFEEVVVLSGQIEGEFELQCVTCLEFFPYQASFPKWQSECDKEDGQISFDPRESLRDEILLRLPVTPHCDDYLPDRHCPKTGLLSKFEHDGSILESEPEKDGADVWGALDDLRE